MQCRLSVNNSKAYGGGYVGMSAVPHLFILLRWAHASLMTKTLLFACPPPPPAWVLHPHSMDRLRVGPRVGKSPEARALLCPFWCQSLSPRELV